MGNNIYIKEIENINNVDSYFNNLFNNYNYLDYDEIYNKICGILPPKLNFSFKNLFHIFDYFEYKDIYNNEFDKINKYRFFVDSHNAYILNYEISNLKILCGNVEGKELDNQQLESIVRNNKNQLVIAGAGSGKTTTIIGKVKYLLKTYKCEPKEILLLSFTNASASEMKERVKKETGIDLDVMTFHKLGLEIIKKSLGKNLNIYDKDLYQAIKEYINKNINDPNYYNKLIYFMSTARFALRDEFDFSTEDEYFDFLKRNKPITLNGEEVKSYGELEIANYLFENGIEYIYEKEYEKDVRDYEHQQYKPDFYLPKYNIYIEYFGIDENRNVASFFESRRGKSASEEYNESIEWKRSIHKKNNTTLIETYYYENKHKNLISNLEKNLKKHNVLFNKKSNDELWNIINKNNKGLFNELCRCFETIINLIKSNNYSIKYLSLLPLIQNSPINKITLDIIEPIYNLYQETLDKTDSIDFNDMINLASMCISENKYTHNYKYVIVDEYQDISNSRYNLLKEMRNQNDYKLFCVGDDWQSIYRFNGSDINLIIDFEKYWGSTYISYIERTYRFTSMMSKLSSDFIMANPKQYRKNIKAQMNNDFAIKFINGYTEEKLIEFLKGTLKSFDKNSTVFFLGRYTFDIDLIKNDKDFVIKYNNAKKVTEIEYIKRKDLKIEFITVHKSKGLQADYVILMNNKNNGLGFPSKINDLPIIKLLLNSGLEEYPYAEERRLFYVALTRAKKQTVLLTIDNNKSTFVEELESKYKQLMKHDYTLVNNIYTCPKCGGKLKSRTGPYGRFL